MVLLSVMCMQFCLCWANTTTNTPSTSFFLVSIPSACLSQLDSLVLLSTVSFLNFFLVLTKFILLWIWWRFYVCETAMIVMEAALLTGVVTGSLTMYTFWAVKRGSDFSFLGPFLFASLMVMLLFSIIQVNISSPTLSFVFVSSFVEWSHFVGYRCFSLLDQLGVWSLLGLVHW